MTLVTKSIDIKTPVENVFTYFARPEHISDQIKTDVVGMQVVPMDIKEGMGVGTTFRIIGDFSGKRLEWDCETTEFIKNEKNFYSCFSSFDISSILPINGTSNKRISSHNEYPKLYSPRLMYIIIEIGCCRFKLAMGPQS